MVIKFVITGAGWKPQGGLKIIYEYANRLANEGHEIEIIYINNSPIDSPKISIRLKLHIKYWYFFLTRDKYKCSSWFKLSPSVKETWIKKLYPKALDSADRVIATTIQSAYALNAIPKAENEIRYYFIQGYENWEESVTDEMVDKSYLFPFRKITVSNWLLNYIETIGVTATVVPNGFDFSKFYTFNPPERRRPESLAVMYSTKFSKGFQDSFHAILKAKVEIPQLKVTVFGLPSRPSWLPQWCIYHQNPTQDQLNSIYNENAIFLASSHSEGWGLTIGEAMSCSCAVVCTDNRGYLEMATPNTTALVSPIQDADSLAKNIIRFISDDSLRLSIASRGNKFISMLDINITYLKFRDTLLNG